MLPGTTEEWVLSVKMYLWLGEVFTTTCLEERKNSILLQYIPTMIFHHSQCCENSQETSQLVSGPIKPKTKALDLQHEAGTQQSLTVTWRDLAAPPQDIVPIITICNPPPTALYFSNCTIQTGENQTTSTKTKAAVSKNQPWFHISSTQHQSLDILPHRSRIPQLWFQQEMDAKPKQGSQCIV